MGLKELLALISSHNTLWAVSTPHTVLTALTGGFYENTHPLTLTTQRNLSNNSSNPSISFENESTGANRKLNLSLLPN